MKQAENGHDGKGRRAHYVCAGLSWKLTGEVVHTNEPCCTTPKGRAPVA